MKGNRSFYDHLITCTIVLKYISIFIGQFDTRFRVQIHVLRNLTRYVLDYFVFHNS